ncbi:hypothetical protein AAFN75_02185 [Algibacter sp. AS12]|uniref:hypothetical protein n=1 Tax=Algibacter sp. AS12 TaxID=3135773 RepID=UPI00398B77C4
MKTVLIVFALFLCKQTFAQQINNDETELTPLILLKYPNIKEAFTQNTSLNKDSFSLFDINNALNTNFTKDDGRHINRNFAFSTSEKLYLSKELLKIAHKFPGDGNNLAIGPKGLLVP